MKRLLLILLAVMVLPSIIISNPVSADKYASSIGVTQVIDNNVGVTYTGKHFVNAKGVTQYEYKATISQAPIYNEDGSKVDCAWYLDKEGTYSIGDNVFTATVTGSEISTTYQGQTMSWNPVVMVDSTEYTTKEPKLLAVDLINENYRNNTLEWDYGVCVRRVRVIEGLIQETWIFATDPLGTVWIKDNAQKSAGFTWAIAPYAYDADGNDIPINQYKQVMASDLSKAVYPVTIDPTEVFVTSASDGYIQKNDGVYNTAWASATGTVYDSSNYIYIGQSNVGYTIFRGYFYFNTSSLPDAVTITVANLSLRLYSDSSTTNFNISIQNGMSTYPHDPLAVGDYNKSNYIGIGGSKNTSTISTGYNNISMNASGISWISLTGTTKLCIRSSKDINGVAQVPGTAEYIVMYSYEKGTGFRPYLEVTYISSAAPTVVTYTPVSSVTETSAVANGSVTSNGSNVITEYGICYGLFANPDTTGTHNSTAGDILGNFSFILTPLVAAQTYYYRAFATNAEGTSYGAEYDFITSPNASIVITKPATAITPSQARLNGYLGSGGGETCQVRFQYAYYNGSAWLGNTSTANQSKASGESFIEDLSGLIANTKYTFRAESINSYGQTNGSWLLFNTSTSSASIGSPVASCYSGSNTIDLYWVKAANSSATYIRWKIGSYPTDIYDGNLLPIQYDVDYTHTGLLSGTSYYYKMWGYDAGNTSATNSTTMCTTTAGSATSTPAPLPTLNPAGATTVPNGSALSNNPLYPLGMLEADAIHVPYGTWWMLVGMGGLVVTGLFIYTRSRNLLAALGAMIIFGVVMSQMGIFPIWIMYVFGLAGIGMSWKELR